SRRHHSHSPLGRCHARVRDFVRVDRRARAAAGGGLRAAADGARQLARRAGPRGRQQPHLSLLQRAGRRDSRVPGAWGATGLHARRVRAGAYEGGKMKLATLMMLPLAAVVAAAGARTARADEALPAVGDVIAKTRAVMDKKADQIVCKVVVDTQLL